MNRSLLIAAVILILLLAPLLGCLGGFWFYRQQLSGAAVSWRSRGAPPEKAVAILDADEDSVYVKTAAERVFVCGLSSEAGNCWAETTWPQKARARHDECPQSLDLQVPNPPGRVVDRRELQFCYADAAYQIDYALLDDGSLYEWQYNGGGYLLAFQLLWDTLCGSLLGLGAGIGASVILWRRGRKPAGR